MRVFGILEGKRNTQLDGWRAFAVMGVMWFHWAPPSWRGHFPFEIGLFFFLTLTGFLIGRILLKDKKEGELTGLPWKAQAYAGFLKRRMVRILIPCYVAMIFAVLVGASDIRNHPMPYFAHVSNLHMAMQPPPWPSGTAHYWTLAIQMQFYLLFPLLIFLVPRKALKPALILFILVAPLSRWLIEHYFPNVYHSQAVTTSCFDYFGVGALLALAMENGTQPADRRWFVFSMISLTGYLILKGFEEFAQPIAGLEYFQQTLLSVFFAGLISSTLAGFHGLLGRVLDHPAVQHVGKISYGLYLFHTPTPLFLGWVLPFLWNPFFEGYGLIFRLMIFALVSWGLAYLCWRFVESGFNKRIA